MGLSAQLRAGVAALCIACLVAPPGLAEPRAGARVSADGALSVRVAQADALSRIEFRWAGGARVSSHRDGQTLVLRFSRYAKPDMTRLRVDPPHWLKGADDAKVGGALQITLNLADDADAKVGEADGATFVNLFAAKSAETAPAPAAPAAPAGPVTPVKLTPPTRPDAVPASGVVKMQVEMSNGHVLLRFPWKAPLGAAVFRRGEAIWVVFDSVARLDLSAAPHGFRQVAEMRAVQGADFSAVRIKAPPDIAATAVAEGSTWTIALSPGSGDPPEAVKVGRDETSISAGLTVTMAGATKVAWVDDPVVGDRIAVVTALAPAKGLLARRVYVDLALPPTAQGLVIEPSREDLTVATDGDIVTISRPSGLTLSPRSAGGQVADDGQNAVQLAAPQPAALPGLIEFEDWSKTGPGGFMARYEALQMAAADEISKGKDAGVKSRMGLARFLIGSELSFETIGLLNLTAKQNQSLLGDAEFRALRGAANAMAGRYKEAQPDLSVGLLSDDPAAALWRGYADEKLGQYADARAQFDAGASALYQFSAKWRGRFARANAEAAVALGQNPIAEVAVDDALRAQDDPLEALQTRLVQAKLFEAEGQKDRALRLYDVLSGASEAFLSTPAQLRATQLRLAQGQITPMAAADVLEGLRYRWRGDATELNTVRALGQIYISMGRYREALEALRSAGQRLPDLPEAVAVQTDLAQSFRTLFLDGQADGLQPIQALALFYDFKELTPIGADGDLMVRRLARRLVDVDLLSQAGELLKYQAENRLDGVPRAEVCTDLATIDLMNRQPEAALEALNESRTTLLPSALSAQRRVIEARAWLGLGQFDHALEIVESDKSPDVAAIRAEVAWKKHDWAGAGSQFEALLGERWRTPATLSPDEEASLLRAGVAMSLAGDDSGLARLRDHYQGFVAQARSADALRVALSGMNGAQLTSTDFTRAAAENDSFIGWVQTMKVRFRAAGAQASAGAPATRG